MNLNCWSMNLLVYLVKMLAADIRMLTNVDLNWNNFWMFLICHRVLEGMVSMVVGLSFRLYTICIANVADYQIIVIMLWYI